MVRPFSPLSFRRCSSASVRNLPPPITPQGTRARPFDGRGMISLCHDDMQLVNTYLRSEPWGEYHVRRNDRGHSKGLGRRQRGFYHCIEHIHWLVLLSMQGCQKSPIDHHRQHENAKSCVQGLLGRGPSFASQAYAKSPWLLWQKFHSPTNGHTTNRCSSCEASSS